MNRKEKTSFRQDISAYKYNRNVNIGLSTFHLFTAHSATTFSAGDS